MEEVVTDGNGRGVLAGKNTPKTWSRISDRSTPASGHLAERTSEALRLLDPWLRWIYVCTWLGR